MFSTIVLNIEYNCPEHAVYFIKRVFRMFVSLF